PFLHLGGTPHAWIGSVGRTPTSYTTLSSLSLQGYCLGQLPIVSCYTDAGARVNAVQCSARTGGRIGAEGRSRATHCACHRAGCLHITSSPDHRPPDAVFPRTTALITNCRDGLHRGRSRTY